jgi:uncharacterized protein
VSELAEFAAWLPSGWTLGTLLASALAIALAGVVRGLTGFGFSALAVSSLSLWLPPAQVVPPVLLLEVLASFWLLPSVWRDIHWNWMAWLVAGNVVGIPLGVMLLADGDANLVKAGIAALVLVFAVALARRWRPPWHDGRGTRLATGLVSGLCNGLAAIGGLAAVVMLLSSAVAVASTRATLIGLFVFIDLYSLAVASGHGLVGASMLVATAWLLLPMLIGVALGSRWYARVDEQRFRRVVVFTLIALASLGLVAAVGRAVAGAS